MARRGYIVLIGILLTCYCELSAQSFISRSALDSLVRPALSAKAEGMFKARVKVRDVGTIADSDIVRVSYTLQNNHSEAIAITTMRASCSCLRITSPRATIAIGEEYTLTVEFNPAGRSGTFSYDIAVYTTLDESLPTERLTLRGIIEPSSAFSHLTEDMGALRLSRKSVVLEQVKADVTRREYIAVANAGERELSIKARTTVEGLSLRCEPAILAPGVEGEIVVEYMPAQTPSHDIETIIIVEGVEATATERIIRVTIKR